MGEEQYSLKGTGGLLKKERVEREAPKKCPLWPLAVVGAVLVAFQVIAIFTSASTGGCPWQQPYFMGGRAFWHGLLSLLSFVWVGIAGTVLIIISLPQRRMLAAGCVAAAAVVAVGVMAYTGTVAAEREREAVSAALASASYVASTQEDAVHRADCKYASWISSRNMLTFNNLEDALETGRHPCETCFNAVLSESDDGHASDFLREKADEQAGKIDREYGPDAYGGSNGLTFSEWTILKEYGYINGD